MGEEEEWKRRCRMGEEEEWKRRWGRGGILEEEKEARKRR